MSARTRQPLDGDWQFWVDAASSLTLAQLPTDDDCRQITVPGPWQAQFADLRTYIGPAWYRLSIEIPAAWFERRIILGFGAVDYRAEVWLNGQNAGEHEGGYFPFELDVTAVARPGKNELVVRVTDPPALFPEIPHGKQSWYGPLSGIWQSVWLENRPAKHIRRVKITPDAATGRVSVAVTTNQPLTETDRLCKFLLSQGAEVAAAAASTAELSATLPSPQLWDIESPHLYTARVTLQRRRPRGHRV
ncbi:MAG: hypothetical protein IPK53_09840 [bacterium]|nr:hypothetical protein [bacterium]